MKTFTVTLLFTVVFIAFVAAQSENRMDKPFSVVAEGNHDRRTGANIHVDGQARLWQSQNQRHEVHGQGSYGQHIGGPYGNSKPIFGGGLIYRHRF